MRWHDSLERQGLAMVVDGDSWWMLRISNSTIPIFSEVEHRQWLGWRPTDNMVVATVEIPMESFFFVLGGRLRNITMYLEMY